MNQTRASQHALLQNQTGDFLSLAPDQPTIALRSGLATSWLWDVKRDLCYADPDFVQLAGIRSNYAPGELSLPVFLSTVHPDDTVRIKQLLETAMQTGGMYEADYRVITTEPEPSWIFSRGRFTYDEQQQPHTFAGVLIDITDRKRAALRAQAIEAGLRLTVEAARIGTWEYTLANSELIWSDRTKELFGLSSTATVDYAAFLHVLHPDDRSRTDRAVQAAIQPGSDGRYDVEYRVDSPNGEPVRWLRAIGQAFFSDSGTAYQLVGTVIDVTQTKRIEEVLNQRVAEQTRILEQQAHQLRTTLDASLNSIIAMTAIRDQSGAVTDFMMDIANEAIIRSNFMRPEEIMGRTLLTVFPGNRENGFFDLYVRVTNSGEAEQSVQYYRDDYGLEGWFEISAVKQGDDGVVVTYNNITERKQAELAARQQEIELKEANAELKRSNESLQQFAHIASHDLQEPLRRIQAFSDILQNQFVDNISDGETDMIRRIQRSANRMQMLIKDLLTYSQLTTRRDSFAIVSLTDVVRDVVSDLEVVIAEKKATIDVGSLPEVLGNSSRLRQLFQNLIANSLKFTEKNRAPLIQIRTRMGGPDELPATLREQTSQAFWLITLVDNGIGFDEKYKERIFAPFQRLHDQASFSGTGIGLSICQRVVESHGGRIDVSSQIGIGSVFSIFLPVPEIDATLSSTEQPS